MVDLNSKEWKVNAVSMGNPHCIIFVDDLENDIDFEKDGPAIEALGEAFPAKTNVEFVQVMSSTHLKMKVWERGAGPTLAWELGRVHWLWQQYVRKKFQEGMKYA